MIGDVNHSLTLCAYVVAFGKSDYNYAKSMSFMIINVSQSFLFLNQARAGRRLACAWFLKIDPVRIVCMCACVCVCVCARGY